MNEFLFLNDVGSSVESMLIHCLNN